MANRDYFRWIIAILAVVAVAVVIGAGRAEGAIGECALKTIKKINKHGPYVGVVVPNSFEMNPLLESSSFVPHPTLPYFDFSGRRFRLGTVGEKKVIIVMTGLGMLNSGIATQLLLTLFRVEGIVHYGIAGNANPDFQIGDVTIPQYWAHSGFWNWQRYGDGPEDELAFESSGDYTRTIGYLKFSDYNNGTQIGNTTETENFLNNVWYQPEEVFPVTGTPEVREHAFWVPVDNQYLNLAKTTLEGMKLEKCVNTTTCLPRDPIVQTVHRGISANVLVDNGAYRGFLYAKFNITPIDMESAAVALVCLQKNKSFIAFRSLSDLAGGGSSISNEAAIFGSLAAQNAVEVAIQFIKLLS
ncbi:hypothetical protein QQ045_015491 [Rhodiola kirilowii]